MTRHRSEEERREQILRAAFYVFCNDGYDGATIDKIAARARLAKGTVYFYYESKAAVFDAVVERECAGPIPPMRDAATLLAWPFFVVLLARAVHDEPSRDLVLKLWPKSPGSTMLLPYPAYPGHPIANAPAWVDDPTLFTNKDERDGWILVRPTESGFCDLSPYRSRASPCTFTGRAGVTLAPIGWVPLYAHATPEST